MLINSYSFGAVAAPFVVDAVRMNVGSDNNGFKRTSQLVGIADSKLCTFSFWAYVTGTWNNARLVWENFKTSSNMGLATASSPNGFRFVMPGTTTSTVCSIRTANTYSLNTWYHIMGSVDLADTGKRHLYVNSASDLSVAQYTNEAMDFTVAETSIGINQGDNGEFLGHIAELWIAPGQYLDLSQSSNRLKFRTADGKPANLGSDGSTPTGTAPIIYQHLDDGEAVANFGLNAGTGGNYTVAGSPATASTSPSD